MFSSAKRPFRVKDLQELFKYQNPDAYICLGESVSPINGKGGKFANMVTIGDDEITIYFEDEDKLIKDEHKHYDKIKGDIIDKIQNIIDKLYFLGSISTIKDEDFKHIALAKQQLEILIEKYKCEVSHESKNNKKKI